MISGTPGHDDDHESEAKLGLCLLALLASPEAPAVAGRGEAPFRDWARPQNGFREHSFLVLTQYEQGKMPQSRSCGVVSTDSVSGEWTLSR